MSALEVVGRRGRTLLRLTPARVLSAAAVVAPVVLGVVALQSAAPEAPLWPAALLVLPVGWTLLDPDGSGGLVVLLCLGGWWLQAGPDPATPWALAAAVAALGFHVAVSVAAAGPRGVAVEAAVLRRLLRGVLAAVTVTAGISWLAQASVGRFESPAALVAVTLALVALLPWLARWVSDA